MSHHFREPRGAQDFSSPQVRVRGANDFRQYSNQRLRLPNERPPLGPRVKQLIGAILTLALLAGIGVGVYFGVTLLLEEDEPATSEVREDTVPAQDGETTATADAQDSQASEPASAAATESPSSQAAPDAEETHEAADAEEQSESSQSAQEAQQASQAQAIISVSLIEPQVADEQVTPAQIGGAEIVAQRLTAEPVPSGIPRTLADGAAYDPTEPATVFTSRWPVGTTLRLTRLPGATLLTDEEQAEVVGTEMLVVVRGTESSNTDLQLSPAAFEQIAFYGTERIIAVRAEVTAAPP
ncbi:MAG: hypothetical protein OXH19_13945 [Chloroflexi bacterium]|nr:hypothetical protein [Chloroflexota bacterium]MCY3587491.1 hypothetical protein [Chloroflexota bacterium]MCY3685522.1 hypothetical protein [Chloroflexota bacterium]MDE2708424.1 hypothetical protein [Chloroflexota bacterium]